MPILCVIGIEFGEHVFPTWKDMLSDLERRGFRLEKACFPQPMYLWAMQKNYSIDREELTYKICN